MFPLQIHMKGSMDFAYATKIIPQLTIQYCLFYFFFLVMAIFEKYHVFL